MTPHGGAREDRGISHLALGVRSDPCGRGRFVLLAFLLFSGCVPDARSQSALYKALEFDNATLDRLEARDTRSQELSEDELKAGPVTFEIAASYSLEFNSNINAVETDPEADFINLPEVIVGLSLPISDQSDLTFSMGIGYQIYARNGELDRLYLSPGTEVAWDIRVKDLFLTLYDQVQYTQDIASEPALTGTAAYPRLDNTIGLRATYIPGRVILSAGYGFLVTVVDDSAFSYLDGNSQLLFGRAGYLLSPELQAGVEVSGTIAEYRQTVNPDGTVGSLGPYVEWRPDPVFHAALRGGAAHVHTDASSFQPSMSETTYYAGLSVGHDLTDRIHQALEAYRGLRMGVVSGGSFIQQTTVAYDITWTARDPLALTLGFGYDHGDQPVTVAGATDEVFDQYRVGMAVSYEMRDNLTCWLAYEYIQRDSNLPGRDYTQNRVTLRAAYQFR